MFLLLVVAIGVMMAFRSCTKRDLEWTVNLDRDDAFTIASVILGQGQVRGCGDLEVTSVFSRSKEVAVKCGNGRSHTLTWFPVFKIDGRTPDRLVWDQPSLQRLFCVKNDSGSWHAAYLEPEKAIAYAEAQSVRTGSATRIYRSDNLFYGETKKLADGTWRTDLTLDTLKNADERRGCELLEETV